MTQVLNNLALHVRHFDNGRLSDSEDALMSRDVQWDFTQLSDRAVNTEPDSNPGFV